MIVSRQTTLAESSDKGKPQQLIAWLPRRERRLFRSLAYSSIPVNHAAWALVTLELPPAELSVYGLPWTRRGVNKFLQYLMEGLC
jgi:hypothetical protein